MSLRDRKCFVRSSPSPLMAQLSVEAQTFYLRSQPYAEEKEEKQKLVRYIIECGKYLESLMMQKLMEHCQSRKRRTGKHKKSPSLSAESSISSGSSSSTSSSGDDVDRAFITNDPDYGEEQFLETMRRSGVGLMSTSTKREGDIRVHPHSHPGPGPHSHPHSHPHRSGGGTPPWEMFVFGSESTGTSCRDSDIDMGICVNFAHCRSDKKYLLYHLATIIGENDQDGVLMIKPLLSAKYPIIRITQNKMGIKIDVSIADTYCQSRNNYIHYIIGAYGSKRYGQCPIRELIVFIKHWSKEKRINNAYQCYLNSFGFTMLAIKFLQFYMTSHIERKQEINVDLGHLIAEFFKFYAEHFDPKRHAISIADPESGTFDDKKAECWMEINDPMNPQNNIAENVGWAQCQRIMHEFRCARDLITKHRLLEAEGFPGMEHDHFHHISLFALLVNDDRAVHTVHGALGHNHSVHSVHGDDGHDDEDHDNEDEEEHDDDHDAEERTQSPDSSETASLSHDQSGGVTESEDSKRAEGEEHDDDGVGVEEHEDTESGSAMEHDLKEISKEIQEPMTYDSIHSTTTSTSSASSSSSSTTTTTYLYPVPPHSTNGGHHHNASHHGSGPYRHSYYGPYHHRDYFQKGAFRSNGRAEPRYIDHHDHDDAASYHMFPHRSDRRNRRDRHWR